MKWAHNMRVTYKRGGLAIVTCSCGMKSMQVSRDEASAAVEQHKQKYLRETPVKRP